MSRKSLTARTSTRTASTTDNHDHGTALPRAESMPRSRAYAGPPCRGRSGWAVTVLSCAVCGGMHQHRVFEGARLLAGRIAKCCPVTGAWYRLAPVARRREARRAA